MILDEFINTVLQILAFSLIPFIVYLFSQRKKQSFLRYIGLTQSTTKANLLGAVASLLFLAGALGLALWSPEIREILFDPQTMTGKFRAMGMSVESVVILLMLAVFKTAFAEEIFFRGFVAKRLMNWLGYQWGNLLQAVIFALVHLLLFLVILDSPAPFLIFIFLFSGLAGYMIVFIKEKYGNGSIIPGWIAHGLGNTISYFVIGFLL